MTTDDADLNLWFEQKLKTLSVEKTALVTADAAPEEVIEKNAQIVDLIDARNAFAAKVALRREEKERATKYAVAYPLACELKEKVEAALHAHERAEAEYMTAEKNVEIIDTAIAEHNSSKPKPQNFPSAKEIRKWALRLRHLEEMRAERKATLRQRVQERNEARAEWSKLNVAFDQAAFTARIYAPRQNAAKPVPVAWAMPSSAPSRVASL